MPALARIVLALLALGAACSSPGGPATPSPVAGPTRTVTGYITEIELGDLSLRALDGRSLIFTLEDSPTPVSRLEEDMRARTAVRITYRAGPRRLVPTAIEELCPGPECPPPYSQPPPSGL